MKNFKWSDITKEEQEKIVLRAVRKSNEAQRRLFFKKNGII